MTPRCHLASLLLPAAAVLAGLAAAQDPVAPPELGRVGWRRDLAAATAEARASDRPLLVLFQEVPGWRTCVDYGAQVLSHPIVVDVAEAAFVPVCIYNNTAGDRDAAARQEFAEPAWNNPVVRLLDADHRDLVPRHAGDYTRLGLARAMLAALEAARREVPPALALLVAEDAAWQRGVDVAVFGMGWFWVGEAKFGLIDGVVKTTAAWLGDHEVVEVHYDPEVITYAELCARARTTGCADRAFPATDAAAEIARGVFGAAEAGDHALRADREPKYYLLQSELRHLPMTELQAVRVNASMQDRPERWLTAGQLRLLARIRANPKADWPLAVGVDVRAAWDAAARVKTE